MTYLKYSTEALRLRLIWSSSQLYGVQLVVLYEAVTETLLQLV